MGSPRNPNNPGFFYDEAQGRYRDARGRFIAQSEIERILQARIDEGIDRLEDYLTALREADADLDQWQEAFAVELRRMHTQIYAYGGGGWRNVPAEEWLEVGRGLKQEYGYLNNFAVEIASGELSQAQIRARMNQYANHAWGVYWQGDQAAKKAAGFDEMMRELNPAEHCDDCRRLAGHWEPLGSLPLPTQGTQCRSNCKCSVVYRKRPAT
jgi:hypothetical protein